MDVHVLNGNALPEKIPFKENIIICRECLMEGPVKPEGVYGFGDLQENDMLAEL